MTASTSFLRRFTLRARFMATLAIVAAALAVLGIWGLMDSQRVADRTAALFDQARAGADGVARLRESLGHLRRLQADIIAVGASNTNEVERLTGLWKAEIGVAGQAAQQLGADAQLAPLVQALGQQLTEYRDAIAPIAQQLQDAKIDGAVALAYAERAEDKAAALLKTADAMRSADHAHQAVIRDEMLAATTRAAQIRLGLVVAALLLALPLAGVGLPLRAHVLAVFAAGAAAAWRSRGQLPHTAAPGALPSLVRWGP